MKTPSIISLGTPDQHQNTFYFIWKRSHIELLDLVHTPRVSKELNFLLGTRKQAQVWCPNDGHRIVTLVCRNEGTIVSS